MQLQLDFIKKWVQLEKGGNSKGMNGNRSIDYEKQALGITLIPR